MPATNNNKKYGQGWVTNKFQDVTLPSGNVAQLLRPNLQALISSGILESVDVLTGVVQNETLSKAEGRPIVDPQKVLDNPSAVKSMMDILDDIVLYVVNRPTVRDKYRRYPETLPDGSPHPKAGERETLPDGSFIPLSRSDRLAILEEEGEPSEDADPIIYVDEVDFEDKTFLMNYVVGGSRDFAQFRQTAEEAVGSLLDDEGSEQAT